MPWGIRQGKKEYGAQGMVQSTGHEAQGMGHVAQGMVYVQDVTNHGLQGVLHVAWEHDVQDIFTPLHCL